MALHKLRHTQLTQKTTRSTMTHANFRIFFSNWISKKFNQVNMKFGEIKQARKIKRIEIIGYDEHWTVFSEHITAMWPKSKKKNWNRSNYPSSFDLRCKQIERGSELEKWCMRPVFTQTHTPLCSYSLAFNVFSFVIAFKYVRLQVLCCFCCDFWFDLIW